MRRHPHLLKSWVVVLTLSLALSSVGLAYGLTHAASANLMSCIAGHATLPDWRFTKTYAPGAFGLATFYHRTVTAVYRASTYQTIECLPAGASREQLERRGTVAVYAGIAAVGAPLETWGFHATQTLTGPIETAFYPQSPAGWYAPNWHSVTLTQHYVWAVGNIYLLDWWQTGGNSRVTWRVGAAHGECWSGDATCAALGDPPLPLQ